MTNTQKQPISNIFKEQSQIIILVAMIIIFSIISPNFRSTENFINLLKQITVIGVISCGMTMVIITGNLDLSVGSVFSLLGLISIMFQTTNNILGIIMPIITALIIGFLNGMIITKFKIDSIITTLGSLSLFSGIALLITNGSIIAGRTGTWFGIVGRETTFGIPNHVYILFIVALVLHVILSRTTFGRKIKYVGTNNTAAEIAGIRSNRVIISAYMISSLSVAIAVLIYASRMTTASPIMGVGFEFDAITAVVIGGTSLDGGRGSILKTVVGVLLLAIIINILTLFNIPFAYQSITKGILILIAIIIDGRSRKTREN